MNKRIFRWLAVAIWCGVIFYFSHQPSSKIGKGDGNEFLDALGHVLAFGLLAFLIFWALTLYLKIVTFQPFILTFLFALLYAISDEWHQVFISGRSASLQDIGIDGIGITLTVLILLYSVRKKSLHG